MSDVASIAMSLVSHTNAGKTSLARTLLREDVGSVFDQAHVTEVSESWTLLETDDARLVLWDTPGFGDTARLLKRLRSERNPVGWFLHQVWDRVADRALWCGQEAVRNVREQSDVVLYLVSGVEHPEDAGYVALELDLLAWLGKPVLVVLNQTGPAGGDRPDLLEPWRAHVSRWPFVSAVLPLDAFTRCWVQEGTLLQAVRDALPAERRAVMTRLLDAWNGRNLAAFGAAVDALAQLVHDTAVDSEPLPGLLASSSEKSRAMERLVQRVEARTRALVGELLRLHGLSGASAARVEEGMRDFVVSGDAKVDFKQGALLGGLLSGAAGGVAADLLAGGLTFGSGAVVGAVLGALGGAGLARGFQLVASRKAPAVRWSPTFLATLLREALLRYLAVAQHGRGRGEFHEEDAPAAWRAALDEILLAHAGRQRTVFADLLRASTPGANGANGTRARADAARTRAGDAASRTARADLSAPDAVGVRPVRALVDDVLRGVLVLRHPGARELLRPRA